MSDEVPMGSEGSIVYGDGVEKITRTTYLLENLEPETEYYARIKSVGDGKESHWVYYEDGETFKTSKDQILKTPTEITDSSIKVSWEENCTVTSLRIYNDNGYDQTILLEAAELENCSITIQGLDPMTAYTIEIYNGDRLRGTVTVNTEAGELAEVTIDEVTKNSVKLTCVTVFDGYTLVTDGSIPTEAEQTISETSTTEVTGLTDNTKYDIYLFNNGVIIGKASFTTQRDYPVGYTVTAITSSGDFESMISSASGNVVFTIPEGAEWNIGNVTINVDALNNFIIWGEGSNKPKLAMTLTIEGTYETVEFYNLELDSEQKDGNWDKTYLINYQPDEDVSSSLDELVVEGCDIFETGHAVRVKHSNGSIGGVRINNCVFNGYKKYAVSLSDLKVDMTNGVNITNSTFVNAADGDYTFRTKNIKCDISVDYCTFYLTTTRAVYDDNKLGSTFTVKNCLFGGSLSDKIKLLSDKSTYSASDITWSKDYGVKDAGISTSELFPDMANGNYKAADSYSIYGDQNWN